MSSRRPKDVSANATAMKLRAELEQLKSSTAAVEAASAVAEAAGEQMATGADAVHAFDNLSRTEQAAGSLGGHPEAGKPIKFMNNAHFNTLIESNALDDNLARRIEAFRAVAQPSA